MRRSISACCISHGTYPFLGLALEVRQALFRIDTALCNLVAPPSEQLALLLRDIPRGGALLDLGGPRREFLLLFLDRIVKHARLAFEPLAHGLQRRLLALERRLVRGELGKDLLELFACLLGGVPCLGRARAAVREARRELFALSIQELGARTELDVLLFLAPKVLSKRLHPFFELGAGRVERVELGLERRRGVFGVAVPLRLRLKVRVERRVLRGGGGERVARLPHELLP